MTQAELLHAFYGAATTSVPTAAAVVITAAQPEIVVPAGYMRALGKMSSSLVLEVGGYMTATATVPTWSFGIAYTSASPPVFSASTPLATPTTAVAPTAGSGSFLMRVNLGLRTLAPGAASTLWCNGRVDGNLFTGAPVLLNPGGSGGTTVTVWQDDLQYYLWPYLTLGAATASNTVTVQYAKLYGEN